MAQTSQVSFRIDKDVKRRAEMVLDDMGLSMSAAITVFLKKSVENTVFHLRLQQTRSTLKAICAIWIALLAKSKKAKHTLRSMS